MRGTTSPTISIASSTLKLSEIVPTDRDDHGLSATFEQTTDASYIEPPSSDTPSTAIGQGEQDGMVNTDDESLLFERSTSPDQLRRNKGATYEKAESLDLHKLHRISVYETSTRFYIIGGDITETHWRMFKIDRTDDCSTLSVVEDEIVYTKKEMNQLLNALEDGNRAAGGMKLVCLAWGILGFIRLTAHYYMLLITKRQQVAMLGGHYIYQVDGTQTVSLSSTTSKGAPSPDEGRYLSILQNIDLHQSFYFSYSYNITRTLQYNISHSRSNIPFEDNSMFVWNQHLLNPSLEVFKNPYDWCSPVIHGFVDQSSVNIFGRNIYITLIARRSRFFAGARFLKRGTNDLGFVANDVETEQIVADMMITSFNGSSSKDLANPNYTSFVQHRGSIPLFWTQDNSGVSPKPAIDINLNDPFFATSGMHFNDLFARYGAPVCCLNLVKQVERTPRESKLSTEYKRCIDYLNQSLPEGKKLVYEAYDMSRMAKKKGVDVIRDLERVATRLVSHTGFFHNGLSIAAIDPEMQNGVIRSNCIDCLDRTNAAQFVIGKRALEFQLQALGITADAMLNYDTDASNLFAHMYNDHGDTLASQYGGSHLVNTTDSYRKINNWQSHSRDMLESFKRYYHNSFLDSQRQEAYNLFLGNYTFDHGQPMLWDLPNDYYLHHEMPSGWSNDRRSYLKWYTPSNLGERHLPSTVLVPKRSLDDWWHEYYRPPVLSSFMRLFAYNINSTTRYVPKSTTLGFDMSPFTTRKHVLESPTPDYDLSEDAQEITPLSASTPPRAIGKRITSLQRWLHTQTKHPDATFRPQSGGVMFTTPNVTPIQEKSTGPVDRSQQNQWSLAQFRHHSLRPSVSEEERKEYERYMEHPLQMPLVAPHDSTTDLLKLEAFVEYLGSTHAAEDVHLGEQHEDLEKWFDETRQDHILSVGVEDYERKRYQAYRKWLKGKSLFKQSKIDPEYRAT